MSREQVYPLFGHIHLTMLRNPLLLLFSVHTLKINMIFKFDDELEDVTESTCNLVFERDGHICWLCGDPSTMLTKAMHRLQDIHFHYFKPMEQSLSL